MRRIGIIAAGIVLLLAGCAPSIDVPWKNCVETTLAGYLVERDITAPEEDVEAFADAAADAAESCQGELDADRGRFIAVWG